MAELFLETLFHYRDEKVYLLHEFVVMEDHIHLILTPSAKFSLEKAMQKIRGAFSFQVGKHVSSKLEIWQPSPTKHLILDEDDFQRHRDYILDNPVRAGLVKHREDWPLSSVHRYFRMDVAPDYLRG
ncbi:MAG TPA: transposase [Candidatus Angelobacter sp.]|nr:transposase [Candidatus Angelobacter sp.]